MRARPRYLCCQYDFAAVAGFLFFYQPGQRQSFIEQGEAAYAAGNYSAAVQAYHQAEAIRPEGDAAAAQAICLGRGLAHADFFRVREALYQWP